MEPAPHRVDVVTALDLLAECLRASPSGCQEPADAAPLLAEAALARLGVTVGDLAVAPIVSESGAASCSPGTQFTIGAVVALRAAHRAERRGATREHALRAARRDVVRLLGVVPQSVFDAAAATRGARPGRPSARDGEAPTNVRA